MGQAVYLDGVGHSFPSLLFLSDGPWHRAVAPLGMRAPRCPAGPSPSDDFIAHSCWQLWPLWDRSCSSVLGALLVITLTPLGSFREEQLGSRRERAFLFVLLSPSP